MAHQHSATGSGRCANPFHRPNTVTAVHVHVSAAVGARRKQRGAPPWHSLFTLVANDDDDDERARVASLPGVDSWRRQRQCVGRECNVLHVPGGLAAAEQTLVERMVPYEWASYDSDSDYDSDPDSGGGWGLLLITDAEWTGQVGSQLMLMSGVKIKGDGSLSGSQ